MSDTGILGTLLGLVGALVGAIYALVLSNQRRTDNSVIRLGERLGIVEAALAAIGAQNSRQERDMVALQQQNTQQETSIGRLTERMVARETAHAEHREDISERLGRMEVKLDQLIRGSGSRSGSPFPGAYGSTGERK